MRQLLLNAKRVWTVVGSGSLAAAIFFIPKTASACTPTGLIYNKWQALYSDLGPCVSDPENDGAGGTIEQFDYGWVDWIYPESQAFAVYGIIGAAWVTRYGGPAGTGQPVTDEQDVWYSPDGRMNQFRNFVSGAYTYLVYNPGTDGTACNSTSDHVCITYGAIGYWWSEQQYESLGDVGLPINEEYTWDSTHRRQDFRYMYATWNSSNGHTCMFWNDGELYAGTGSPC